jgi:hypothetical protein
MRTFATKDMERRLGHSPKPSWALSHVHIKWMDNQSKLAWGMAGSAAERHDIAGAATTSLLAHLGWLGVGEIFEASATDGTGTTPVQGPTRGFPHVGAVEVNLWLETKSDPCRVAGVVISYETLSGLSLAMWMQRLLTFEPARAGHLFSSKRYPMWTSRIFREDFAWPVFESMGSA